MTPDALLRAARREEAEAERLLREADGFRYSFACPKCGEHYNRVIESRYVDGRDHTRRRHECLNGHRFTTYEQLPFQTRYIWGRARRVKRLSFDHRSQSSLF